MTPITAFFFFPITILRMGQIAAKDLHLLLRERGGVTVIDVRTPQEYQKGHIQGSSNIPLDRIHKEILSVVPDKKTTVYLYCLSGSRSSVAVSRLEKLGYGHIFDLTSGLLAWRSKSFPLVT